MQARRFPYYQSIEREGILLWKSTEEADYADEPNIDETTARQTLAEAERFVDRLERFLREVGAL